MSSLVLPKITDVTLSGFAPLFKKTITIKIPQKAGPFVILGGNGLGKTTILQSIVFGLAGISDKSVQEAREDHHFKWDSSYFKNRLDDPKNAEIIVGFELGECEIQVRRGMDRDIVRGVRIDGADWINSKDASENYEKIVVHHSGCSSYRDFRYLIHRLCYLPETRRNIVWDPDAQLAMFLLICGEPGVEEEMRQLVKEWRSMHTDMRHTKTSITNIEQRLKKAEAAKKGVSTVKAIDERANHETSAKFDKLTKELSENSKALVTMNKKLISKQRSLSVLSKEIEEKESMMSEAEESYVLHALKRAESSDNALAIQKLLVWKRCPFCTQENNEFSKLADAKIKTGLCPICGLNHASAPSSEKLSEIKTKLLEKIGVRRQMQQELDEMYSKVDLLQDKSAMLQSELKEVSINLPRIRKDEKVGLTEDPEDLRHLRDVYENERKRLEQEARSKQVTLEEKYARIERSQGKRYKMIEERVEKYATKFLGTACSFARVAGREIDKDTPFAFDVLVPNFDKHDRVAPESCSESQAFFLDIAFRMALLDVIQELSGKTPTFICETPENSLDMAYSENVAEMFVQFSKSSCSSLMTANLQAGGVAEPLLRHTLTTNERKNRVLNLLDYARLTPVQKSAKNKLNLRVDALIEQ